MSEEETMQAMEIEAMKKMLLRRILDKNAMERLSRVRMVNPALASQVEMYLIQLYHAGQIKEVNDEKLKQMLAALSTKKEWKIRRQRKCA